MAWTGCQDLALVHDWWRGAARRIDVGAHSRGGGGGGGGVGADASVSWLIPGGVAVGVGCGVTGRGPPVASKATTVIAVRPAMGRAAAAGPRAFHEPNDGISQFQRGRRGGGSDRALRHARTSSRCSTSSFASTWLTCHFAVAKVT